MAKSRRTFFEEIMTSGSLLALLAESGVAQSRPGNADPSLMKTSDFWGSFYDGLDPKKSKGLGRALKGKTCHRQQGCAVHLCR